MSHLRSRASQTGAYSATIEALLADGRSSPRSREIMFRRQPALEPGLNLPAPFKAKIVWANISAWINRNLL